jgi:flagellar motor switch protein FliG
MSTLTNNLRKAAILIRSLDADAAAKLLGQLSTSEAKSLRLAMQSLGPIDADERAEVLVAFQQGTALPQPEATGGVELELSNALALPAPPTLAEARPANKPFDFLEHARIESLIPYLAREQSQTIAVVLSHFAPARAASVLSALPARLQAETIERLSQLGETDDDSLQVIERELSAWLARQQPTKSHGKRRTDAIAAILAAADATTRGNLLTNLAQHNRQLAEEVAPNLASRPPVVSEPSPAAPKPTPIVPPVAEPVVHHAADEFAAHLDIQRRHQQAPTFDSHQSRPSIKFDDLARLDQSSLAAVLRTVDAEVLVLALAGADEELIERIAEQMPRATAKAFRRRMRQLGPTRLRDVSTAQQEVADVAARIIHSRRRPAPALVG